MEVRLLIKKRAVKRRGGMMADALVAMIIVALVIIPVSAAIAFVYSSIVGSAEISARGNEFFDKVDSYILNNIFDDPDFELGDWFSDIVITRDVYEITADLRRIVPDEDVLRAGSTRRVPVSVYMIQKKNP